MNPANWLQRTAIRVPQAPALLDGERLEADYSAFAQRSSAVGAGLRSQCGIKPGDRVVIFLKNHTRYLELMYGAWFIGAVVVPVNAKLHVRELVWIVENSRASVVLCSEQYISELRASLEHSVAVLAADNDDYFQLHAHGSLTNPVRMRPDDLLWLFYTSGTTGRPKGVMISCGNALAMCGSYLADVDTVEPEDTALYAAPMSHGAGIYNFMHVMRGARHVVPVSGGFDEREVFQLSQSLEHVSLFAAPTMVKRLVDYAKKHSLGGEGIKTIVYGGGPMYLADICDGVEVLGDRFVQIYGQGECPMAISALSREQVSDRSNARWRERLASVGQAQSCVDIRIADKAGESLPTGRIGEILVSGTAIMLGYWDNPEATANTIRDGWLWTGDMGSLDSDGYLTLQDRSKDMIISGGSNIYPREVEEVLLLHDSVSEVSVVGKQDADWGEIVVAFVVLADTDVLNEKLLDAHCLEHIARFKRPKRYVQLQALPKNNYGKVLKTELRKRLN